MATQKKTGAAQKRSTGKKQVVNKGSAAHRKKGASRKGKRNSQRRLAPLCAVFFALIICVLLGYGTLHAFSIHVRHADLYLADLPSSFDGTTILYASDIDIFGLNSPERAADLFHRLAPLKPDILLLGGDYTSESVFSILNRSENASVSTQAFREKRRAFFHSLNAFEAPLGKFAIASASDGDLAALRDDMQLGGLTPLFDNSSAIRKDGEILYLAGLTGDPSVISTAAHAARRENCVIALTPEPCLIPRIMISEVDAGGAWYDAILTGHTHGGQIRLFGLSALSLNEHDRYYLKGWRTENGIPILTTTGVGCEGLNVRIGSQAEVWTITLHHK